MGVFGLTSFMVARRETAGQHYHLHDLPDGAAGVVVVDALAILHWLLKESDAPHLLGGEYQELDKQLRWLISCLCYGRSAYPHQGSPAAAGDTGAGRGQDGAGEDSTDVPPRLLQLRFLADGAPLTAPGSERKIDTWQERAGERLEDARRLAEHCTALLPSPPPPPAAAAAAAALSVDGEKKDSSDAVEIAQLFRKPDQEQAIEAQTGLSEAAETRIEAPMPRMAMRQLQATIEAMAREARAAGAPPPAEFAVTPGEADDVAAGAVAQGEAFCVLSSDSDFAVMSGSRLLLLQELRFDGSGPAIDPSGWVFCPETVSRALGIEVAQLPDVAALCGNDITSSAMDKSGLPSAVGLTPRRHAAKGRGGKAVAAQRVAPLDAALWIRGAMGMRLEDSPQARTGPHAQELRASLEASRQFFSSGAAASPKKSPSAADAASKTWLSARVLQWLEDGMAAGRLPSFALSVAVKGHFWGSHGAMSFLHGALRQRMYALLGRGGQQVTECVPHRNRTARAAQDVPATAAAGLREFWVPAAWELLGARAATVSRLSAALLAVADAPEGAGVEGPEDPGGSAEVLRAADALQAGTHVGLRWPEPGSPHGLAALALQYLLHALALSRGTPHEQHIADWEFLAIVATVASCSLASTSSCSSSSSTSTTKPGSHGLWLSVGSQLEARPPLSLLRASDALQSSLTACHTLLQLTGALEAGLVPPLEPSSFFCGRHFAAVYCQAAHQGAEGSDPGLEIFCVGGGNSGDDGATTGKEKGSPTSSSCSSVNSWDWSFGGLLRPPVAESCRALAEEVLKGAPSRRELPLVRGISAATKAAEVAARADALGLRLPEASPPPQAAAATPAAAAPELRGSGKAAPAAPAATMVPCRAAGPPEKRAEKAGGGSSSSRSSQAPVRLPDGSREAEEGEQTPTEPEMLPPPPSSLLLGTLLFGSCPGRPAGEPVTPAPLLPALSGMEEPEGGTLPQQQQQQQQQQGQSAAAAAAPGAPGADSPVVRLLREMDDPSAVLRNCRAAAASRDIIGLLREPSPGAPATPRVVLGPDVPIRSAAAGGAGKGAAANQQPGGRGKGPHTPNSIGLLGEPSPGAPATPRVVLGPDVPIRSAPGGAGNGNGVAANQQPGGRGKGPKTPNSKARRAKSPKLAVWDHEEDIVERVWGRSGEPRGWGATCIAGETGCGKSTVVPLLLMRQSGKRGEKGRVVVTQPRRLAAASLARRVAEQTGQKLGGVVGYAVGQERCYSRNTRLLYVTTGYLLEKLAHNPKWLQGCSHVILDEAHERSTEMDLLAMLLRRLRGSLPGCLATGLPHLTVMSATLQATVFNRYFSAPPGARGNSAPEPSGAAAGAQEQEALVVGRRRFPVAELFLEDFATRSEACAEAMRSLGCSEMPTAKASESAKKLAERALGADRAELTAAAGQLGAALAVSAGRAGAGVLVFVPGLAEIAQLSEALEAEAEAQGVAEQLHGCILHSLVPADEQETAMLPPPEGCFKVVLATNVAESSITIPDVTVVIDFCLQRVSAYNEAKSMPTLQLEWTSAASKAQRAGRAGRVAPGVVFHVVSWQVAAGVHPDYDPPALLRESLDHNLLRLKARLGHLGEPRELLAGAPQPPEPASVDIALGRLRRSGCLIGPKGMSLSPLGHTAAHLPVSVPLARLLVLGTACGYGESDCVVMAAGLSLSLEPYMLPHRSLAKSGKEFLKAVTLSQVAREQADACEYSDPISYVRLYSSWLVGPRTHAWANKNGLSFTRMKQLEGLVVELARKLPEAAAGAGIKVSPGAAERLEWLGSRLKLSKQDRVPNMPGSSRKQAAAEAKAGADAPPPLFLADPDIIRCLLVAAFSPNVVVGAVNRAPPVQERKVRELKLDPGRTLMLRGLPAELRKAEKAKAVLEHAAGPGCIAACHKVGNAVWAEFAADEEGGDIKTNPDPLLEDLPLAAKRLCAVAQGRTWDAKVPNPWYPAPPGSPDPQPQELLSLGKLEWSNTIIWSQILDTKQKVKPGWRGPLHTCADTGGEERAAAHLAVALGFLQTRGAPLHAMNLTLLPSRGALGLMMVLAMLADTSVQVSLCVERAAATRSSSDGSSSSSSSKSSSPGKGGGNPGDASRPRRVSGVMLGPQRLLPSAPAWLTSDELEAVEDLRAATKRAFLGDSGCSGGVHTSRAPPSLLQAIQSIVECSHRVAMRPPLSKEERKGERWIWQPLPRTGATAGSKADDECVGMPDEVLEPLGLVEALELDGK